MKNPNVLRKTDIPQDMLPGTVHKTKKFGDIEVVNYVNSSDVVVKFVGYTHEVKTRSDHVRSGTVKNVMLPSVYGKGFIGVGNYSCRTHPKAYKAWSGILQRSYCPIFKVKYPTYRECEVSSEWFNFQVFVEWFKKADYSEGYHLDKDLRVQGNKVYGPEYCQFVSQKINTLLITNNASRGKYMLGVYRDKDAGKFQAHCQSGSKKLIRIGSFSKELEAHNAYCAYKYALIAQVAEEQQNETLKHELLNWVIPEY